MKKLLVFFLVLFMGCSMKEDKTRQTANYIAVTKNMYRENVSKIRRIEKSISDNGYKKDTVLLKAAIELLNNSDAVVNKKQSLNKHYEYLLEKYTLLGNKDTTSLNRAHAFLEQFNQNQDSTHYYHYILNTLLLESDILDFYCEQVGADRITFYTMIFKESDTTKVNTLYTFIIFPADYRYSYSSVVVDSLVDMRLDDKNITVPIHFKQTGGAVTATLTPTQKGKYHIKGNISVTQKAYRYTTENPYAITFIVE